MTEMLPSGPHQPPSGHDSGCQSGIEDISPYEDLAPPRPPPADFTALGEAELERLIRNALRIQGLVGLHKNSLLEEVCPALTSLLGDTGGSLTRAGRDLLFKAGATARDSWEHASFELHEAFRLQGLPPFFQRYCEEVRESTALLESSLRGAQLEDGPDWRKEVEQALGQVQRAAKAGEAEAEVYLAWIVTEAKRELCEQRSVGFGLHI